VTKPRGSIIRCSPCLALLLAASAAAAAPPPPTPPAIDQPHAYYYSEMYLPQLTAGPASLAWSPDSRELVYSMAGSLWRQRIDATLAVQLTDGPGYDYQPDWSPDGRFIVYTSAAAGGSSELWLLDVPGGRTSQLTHDGAVDLEPRWSPDGQQLVYVSSVYHRHFHVFVADFHDGRLSGARRLTGETTSAVPRYYYGPTDVEINPSWTRDGRAVLYVSNRGHLHGTGGFWRLPLEPNAPAVELHYEETNWQARPEMSPDGRRMVYSSYLGRQWLQLWLLPADGGDAFQLTFGDWDDTGPRWSPDGGQLAFISNRGGGTGIELLAVPGGPARSL
jgi:TolB protein